MYVAFVYGDILSVLGDYVKYLSFENWSIVWIFLVSLL